jgi:ribosomal protein S18 acetylase RimI-like enzyme
MMFLSDVVRDAADLDNRITSALDYGSKSGFPWMFCLSNEWLPESLRASQSDALGRRGLQAAMALTGMVMDMTSAPSLPPGALEYRRVNDRETIGAISDVNCAAYEIPLEMGRESISQGMFGDGVFAYVGYLDSRPVTAAGVWMVDGILYVGMVATHPDHRRKGYAEAVMWLALQQAQRATGASRTVLHATDAGFPIYRRMGYRSVARFIVYAKPGH